MSPSWCCCLRLWNQALHQKKSRWIHTVVYSVLGLWGPAILLQVHCLLSPKRFQHLEEQFLETWIYMKRKNVSRWFWLKLIVANTRWESHSETTNFQKAENKLYQIDTNSNWSSYAIPYHETLSLLLGSNNLVNLPFTSILSQKLFFDKMLLYKDGETKAL